MADSPQEPARWYIVHKNDGDRAEGAPAKGFATQDEAEEFYMAVFQGDPKLEVRQVPIP